MREKLQVAREQWEAVATPAQLNQLIGEFVGPSLVTAEGRLLPAVPNENPVQTDEGVHGVIAGDGFDPAEALRVTTMTFGRRGRSTS